MLDFEDVGESIFIILLDDEEMRHVMLTMSASGCLGYTHRLKNVCIDLSISST